MSNLRSADERNHLRELARTPPLEAPEGGSGDITFALPVEYQGEVGTPPGQRERL
jgi:hypothetical protein